MSQVRPCLASGADRGSVVGTIVGVGAGVLDGFGVDATAVSVGVGVTDGSGVGETAVPVDVGVAVGSAVAGDSTSPLSGGAVDVT
jgi:hypothetical protein